MQGFKRILKFCLRLSFFILGLMLFSLTSMSGLKPEPLKVERYVAFDSETKTVNRKVDLWAEKVNLESNLVSNDSIETCRVIAQNTLIDFENYLEGFEKLVIHMDSSKRRGLSNGESIYLRCLEDKNEYLDVMIHELGHSVDLLYFAANNSSSPSTFTDFGKPIYKSDLSLGFYSLSWVNSETLRSTINRKDFVSGYAMSDPFEDFAESFLFYVRYGEIFRFLANNPENFILKQKYIFLRDTVFNGFEYNLDKDLSDKAFLMFSNGANRLFDVTKLYNLV